MTNPKTIAIVGYGTVGKALHRWFNEALINDPYKGLNDDFNKADIIFLCLPTPTGAKGQDLSCFWDVLAKIKRGKTVVIKSTVLPGTTYAFQRKFPELYLFHNPEFLRAISAAWDLVHPDLQIVGETPITRGRGRKILRILPKAPFQSTMLAFESETVKYMINCFLACKVIFANQFYDFLKQKRYARSYERIKNAVYADARMGRSHFSIALDGRRGCGGACLPKDLEAFVKNSNLPLLDLLLKMNKKYRRQTMKRPTCSESWSTSGSS